MNFIHEDFLLHSESARRLYHGFAEHEPILDYHSHLSPSDVLSDRSFGDLFEIWLEGDHYKWRAMRANGIPEEFCTGAAPPYEKFLAWARTVPHTLRNPLYHWSHLELSRYFDIYELLDESSARRIWDSANIQLTQRSFSPQALLRKFKVHALCTTDDPCDDLAAHRELAASDAACSLFPTFRPDKALGVETPELFNRWIVRLERVTDTEIVNLEDFLTALRKRHDYFHQAGGRLSDHGLPYCYTSPCPESEAARIFGNVRSGKPATPDEHEKFASCMMLFFGRLDAEKGWTKQLHLGAMRSVNSRAQANLGPDTGFDTIGDRGQAARLCSYLDFLDQECALPKIIVYNLNPADNYTLAAAVGNFQDSSIPGKIQFGSAWWFLDQKDGIEQQLNALSNTGLLSRFVGMVTDSRSFMSFPRHEYFRRVLCDLVGREVENGDLPNDENLLGTMIRNICYENARQYLGLAIGKPAKVDKVREVAQKERALDR